nr:hypothetical protein [Thiohalobacter sp. COW1]
MGRYSARRAQWAHQRRHHRVDVYIDRGLNEVSSPSPLLVIDGRQRLTTATRIIVDISLSRDQGNPQHIFESMNSTGRELSTRWI